MGRLKALILTAGVAAAAAASPAFAADLLPPPPMLEPPPPAPEFSGWYLRGDVGVAINEFDSFRPSLAPANANGGAAPAIGVAFASIADSGIIDAGVGYQFNSWLRADLTGEYRTQANYRVGEVYTAFCAAGPVCLDSYNAGVSTALFMANGYVDLGTWYGLTPYVGAGLGAAFHKYSGLTDIGATPGAWGVAADKSQTNFAWAVMAGVGYNVTPNLKLELGYRYIDMGKVSSNSIACVNDLGGCFYERHSYQSVAHDLRIGFRYLFGEGPRVPTAFMAPPGPLVRKY
jgi:opacity protein-like surface antigen